MSEREVRYEILLAEDERAIRNNLAERLRSGGYSVRTAADGIEALELHRGRRSDLLLLDIMMPKMDGITLCKRIRETDTSTPVVFLTALDSDADELAGLEAGADIYIPKTVSDEVLLARIAAAIRRSRKDEPRGDFSFAGWRVTPLENAMHDGKGRRVPISEREAALLRLLAMHPGEVLSRDYLCNRLWGVDCEIREGTLYVTVSRLREKLGPDATHVKSVRNGGYVYRRM